MCSMTKRGEGGSAFSHHLGRDPHLAVQVLWAGCEQHQRLLRVEGECEERGATATARVRARARVGVGERVGTGARVGTWPKVRARV